MIESKAALNSENLDFLVRRYSHDPKAYFHDILKFERLDPWQEWLIDTSQTYGKGGKKIAVTSAHGTGKTLTCSGLATHRLLTYPECQGKITSATKDQLKQAFGCTLEKVIENSVISSWFDQKAESIRVPGIKNSWIQLQAWSKNRPESFAGNHSQSPFLIGDEASAIDRTIFESFDGSMMHPNSLEILLGNPLKRDGVLFDAFHKKAHMFNTKQVSAYDSSFVSKKWIEDMAEEYGEDSDVFRVRVLGLFPRSSMAGFIPIELIEAAEEREFIPQHNEPIVGGLDIGRTRDASVLCIRQGSRVLGFYMWRTRDTMIVAEEVAKLIVSMNIQKVVVDANGVGAGVADRLRQLAPGKVIDVSLSTLSIDDDKEYFNRRTRLWGTAKKWLRYGSFPKNEEMKTGGSDLLYGFDMHGRFQLESKELAFMRGVSSPDTFDSFTYTFGVTIIPPSTGFNTKRPIRRVKTKMF